MNWSPHLRSLDRIVTLLSILGFILAGAFLFVSYFGGTTSERGFLTIRHRPRSHQPISAQGELPRAQPDTRVNPPIKSNPEKEAEGQESSVPLRSSAAATKPGLVTRPSGQTGEGPSLVLPNEPKVFAIDLDPELRRNSLFLGGQLASNYSSGCAIGSAADGMPPPEPVAELSSLSLVAAASAFGAAVYFAQRTRSPSTPLASWLKESGVED